MKKQTSGKEHLKKQVTRKSYETYIKNYNIKEQTIIARGGSMESSMLTFPEYKEQYEATRNTLVQDVKDKKRKAVGNVNQEIISKQAYQYTKKQAKAMKEAAKTLGKDLTMTQIRSGNFDWTEINEAYEEKVQSDGKAKAALYISKYYFGSD